MTDNKIKVGITHGDTNGIGYEVILRALEDPRMADLCTIVIYGSAKAASFYRKAAELQPVQLQRVDNAAEARDGAFNIINVVGEDLKIEPGVASAAAGEAAVAALRQAVDDLRNGDIDVLVTAPINKHSAQSDNFRYAGHTEFLEAELGDGDDNKALMVMCNDQMRIALATTHTPIAKVPEALTVELLTDKLRRFNLSLRRDFGVHAPRIAVLSLNPHAGEEGLLGTEEAEVITPAIEAVRQEKIMAFGPYAADGFFGSGAYKVFDGILAMYHDQGLAPFKALSMDSGVNFTAGLPYVRTSPDHGTGFDIAGKGTANPDSLRCAIYAAIDIYRNRLSHKEAYSHPLRRQHNDKDKDRKEE